MALDSLMVPTHGPRVRGGEDEPGGLDRDIGAGADRDAHIGAGERGGVVDAVADHGDGEAAAVQLVDLGGLVLGEDLGEHFVDTEVGADRFGDLGGVTGDHDDPPAHGPQLGYRLSCLQADLVFEGETSDDPVARTR